VTTTSSERFVTTETDWLWGAEFLYSESEGFHIVAVVYAGSGVRRPEQRADADLRERQGGAAVGRARGTAGPA
jgi:hypothetical protein